jgi:hypothetical protein
MLSPKEVYTKFLRGNSEAGVKKLSFNALRLGFIAFIVGAPFALADTVSMNLVSPPGGDVMAWVYTSPYTATVNGVSTLIVCDQFFQDSYFGESWSATMHTLSEGTGVASNDPVKYQEAAWLIINKLLPATDATVKGEVSYAIWALFTPSPLSVGSPSSSVLGWLQAYGGTNASTYVADAESYITMAQNSANYGSISADSIVIYTPNSNPAPTCYGGPCPGAGLPQEFISIRTPEAPAQAVLAVNFLAMLGLGIFFRRRMVN